MNRVSLFVVGLIATVAIVVTAQFVFATYQGPTQPFPQGNPPAPLDTGNKFQYKNQGIGFTGFTAPALEFTADQTITVRVGATSIPLLYPFKSTDQTTMLRPGSGGLIIGKSIDKPTEDGKLCFADGTCKSSWTGVGPGTGESFWDQVGTFLSTKAPTWTIGIGVSDPAAKLTVVGSGVTGKKGSAGDTIAAYANSGNATIYSEQTGTGYALYADGRSAFMSGNVGVGIENPLAKLSVQGDVVLSPVPGGGIVPGPQLVLEAGDIGTAYSLTWSATDFEKDNTLTTDPAANAADTCAGDGLKEYTSCDMTKGARSCTDVARLGTAAGYYKRTVTCSQGELGKYSISLRLNNRALRFSNSDGQEFLQMSASRIRLPQTIELYNQNYPVVPYPAAGTVLTSDGTGSTRWTTVSGGGTTPTTYWAGGTGGAISYTGGRVGIGTSNPGTTLDVNGTFAVRDGSQGLGKVLTSDANGVASWKAPESREKLCSAVLGGSWRDTIVVPDTWTKDTCARYVRTITGTDVAVAQVGCFSTVDINAPVSWGSGAPAYYGLPGSPSDNSCGW